MTARFWPVPPLFEGETVVCIGGGPSLTAGDVDRVEGKARVVAVNDAHRLPPWADVLYGCDRKWWRWHGGVPEFPGLKVSLEETGEADIKLLGNSGELGFDPDRRRLRTGANGGYQAIHLAVHLGARRIVLLGYDMKPAPDGRTHWFGEHPVATKPSVFAAVMLPKFPTLKAALDRLGVEVVNATPDSALTIWPTHRLDEVL